ncbi:LptF/LptG family permease [Mucilaginibacter ginkgonis]|uniref:LptF/LptG family permease n=1 Tax=Mucilaginibacter ginkgonis TaxID=2682091 RepID=A0A6I4I2Q8_9SPHI|nr:LptF/LptG family permease [Mucilaginibacter ginkgonis]QQL49224.1 LptF/LptG family permease [Mucilaginibacter ginkgonis]
MKKIHLLILKSFIRPFIVTFFVVMFVLLMLFLFKYIDDLIGKGFQWYIILELMAYSSATNVAMALPLSVLLSSIMTYGSLGENYELVAIKSAGISLRRAMYPMIIVISVLAISAFLFSDYMLPIANLKFYSLLYDARQQKSAFLIKEGVFNNSFQGYSIRVDRKDPDGQTLHGIMIYQRNPAENNNNVLFAKEGLQYRTPNNQYLVLQLKDGIRYEENPGQYGNNNRQRFTRFRFKTTEQKFDLSVFDLKRTAESDFSRNFQMMNAKQLRHYRDSTQHHIDSGATTNFRLVGAYYRYFAFPHKYKNKTVAYIPYKPDSVVKDRIQDLNIKSTAIANASNEATSIKNAIKLRADNYKNVSREIRSSIVEYQKKFTLSVACLALFLIGAPLGAIIRKGGLGLPVVVSVIFFLIYYIISTIGEKSVKEGDMSPLVGMWIAIFVLTPIGLFLSYKAATDSVLFDVDLYKKFFSKFIPKRFQKNAAR